MRVKDVILIVMSTTICILLIMLGVNGKSHKKEVEILQRNLAVSQSNEKECFSTLSIQNEAIEKVRVDTVWIDKEINVLTSKYSIIRDTVMRSIEKDNSHENQLRTINNLLNTFSTSGVRPKNSN